MTENVKVHDVFVSYSRKDTGYKNKVRDFLRNEGFVVWTDDHLQPGTPQWEQEIDEAIQSSTTMIVICSPEAKQSEWVGNEIALAHICEARIFPILLRGNETDAVPFRILRNQRVDARHDPDNAIVLVTKALKNFLKRTDTTTKAPPPKQQEQEQGSVVPAYVKTVARIGSADFRTINDAIKNSPEGTRIMVKPGVYREGLILNKSVEIIGDGARDDIILESTDTDVIYMQTDYAVVRGLTIRGRTGTKNLNYYAIDIPKGRLILEDCDITNDSLSSIGIHSAAADPVIRRCVIHDSGQCGIYCYEGARGTIEECEIRANSLAGIEIKEGANMTVTGCELYDGEQVGILVGEDGLGTIVDCNIHNNKLSSIEIKLNANPTIRRCHIHGGHQVGVYFREKSQGLLENCDIYNNAYSGVEVKTDANPVIHDCRIYDGQQSGIMVWENALGTIEFCDIYSNAYSGIEIKTGGDPIIRKCNIHNGIQNGVYVQQNGIGTIEDCEINENGFRGVEIKDGSNPTIRNCRILNNEDQGVWTHNNGRGIVEDCTLRGNKRGAFLIDDDSTLEQRNNIT